MTVRYLDLFSGIGGFRKGMEQACKNADLDCKCVGFSEKDKFAIQTYKANYSMDQGEKELGDITDITGMSTDKETITEQDLKKRDKLIDPKIPDFDVLFAGFPCQAFSSMGEKKGFQDTRGTLFFHIERILSAKKPSFFVLENVRGLLNHNGGETFEVMKKILKNRLGYNITHWVLNTSDYGLPHTRRRVFILGFKNDGFMESIDGKPEKTDLTETDNPTVWHLLDADVDEKYYLSEKIKPTILSNGTGGYEAESEINQSVARPLCATMHKMHRAHQDNYYNEPYLHGEYDPKSNEIKLDNSKDEDSIRRLTPKEAFRLQGFPDSFVKNARKAGVSDTQMYRQAGNAVSVDVVQAVMDKVLQDSNRVSEIEKDN